LSLETPSEMQKSVRRQAHSHCMLGLAMINGGY